MEEKQAQSSSDKLIPKQTKVIKLQDVLCVVMGQTSSLYFKVISFSDTVVFYDIRNM